MEKGGGGERMESPQKVRSELDLLHTCGDIQNRRRLPAALVLVLTGQPILMTLTRRGQGRGLISKSGAPSDYPCETE